MTEARDSLLCVEDFPWLEDGAPFDRSLSTHSKVRIGPRGKLVKQASKLSADLRTWSDAPFLLTSLV